MTSCLMLDIENRGCFLLRICRQTIVHANRLRIKITALIAVEKVGCSKKCRIICKPKREAVSHRWPVIDKKSSTCARIFDIVRTRIKPSVE